MGGSFHTYVNVYQAGYQKLFVVLICLRAQSSYSQLVTDEPIGSKLWEVPLSMDLPSGYD